MCRKSSYQYLLASEDSLVEQSPTDRFSRGKHCRLNSLGGVASTG